MPPLFLLLDWLLPSQIMNYFPTSTDRCFQNCCQKNIWILILLITDRSRKYKRGNFVTWNLWTLNFNFESERKKNEMGQYRMWEKHQGVEINVYWWTMINWIRNRICFRLNSKTTNCTTINSMSTDFTWVCSTKTSHIDSITFNSNLTSQQPRWKRFQDKWTSFQAATEIVPGCAYGVVNGLHINNSHCNYFKTVVVTYSMVKVGRNKNNF